MDYSKDVVEEESVRMLRRNLVGIPLALSVVHGLESKYQGRIPLAVAESTLEDTNGVLLHGRSTDFVLDRLQYYGVISIEDGFVLPIHDSQ